MRSRSERRGGHSTWLVGEGAVSPDALGLPPAGALTLRGFGPRPAQRLVPTAPEPLVRRLHAVALSGPVPGGLSSSGGPPPPPVTVRRTSRAATGFAGTAAWAAGWSSAWSLSSL